MSNPNKFSDRERKESNNSSSKLNDKINNYIIGENLKEADFTNLVFVNVIKKYNREKNHFIVTDPDSLKESLDIKGYSISDAPVSSLRNFKLTARNFIKDKNNASLEISNTLIDSKFAFDNHSTYAYSFKKSNKKWIISNIKGPYGDILIN